MKPKYFKTWIIFFAIVTVGGFILGAGIGAFLGIVLHMAGMELAVVKVACAIAGFIISIPLSYFTFRWTVSEFIVKELAQRPVVDAPPPIVSGPTEINSAQ
jgi:multisubunit Na+/H+ antiporter MnhE subunit